MRLISCALLTVLSLTACSSPNPVGRGYAAYHDKYKSAPGTKGPVTNTVKNRSQDDATREDMQTAAADLVHQLDKIVNFTVDKIYLKSNQNSTFDSHFDFILREELINNGYTIEPTASDAITLHITIEKAMCNKGNAATDNQKTPHMITIRADGRGQVSGQYNIKSGD